MIDTSALVALLLDEPEASLLRAAMAGDSVRLVSTVSVLEATCVLTSRIGPAAVFELAAFLNDFHMEQVQFDAEQLAVAQRAWMVYGKGRHKAGLNFGDCASYALAQSQHAPLLFIGNDFSRTDIAAALRR